MLTSKNLHLHIMWNPLLMQSITHHINRLLFPCGEMWRPPVYVVINSDCSLTFRFTQRHPVIHILLLLYLLVTRGVVAPLFHSAFCHCIRTLYIQLIKSRPRHTLILLAFANEACLPLHNSPKELSIQLLGYRQMLMTKMLTTLTVLYCIIIQLQMRNMTLKK